MRYYKCDKCDEDFEGAPESFEDIIVGKFKIVLTPYKNTPDYEFVDFCIKCKIELLYGLYKELAICATES